MSLFYKLISSVMVYVHVESYVAKSTYTYQPESMVPVEQEPGSPPPPKKKIGPVSCNTKIDILSSVCEFSPIIPKLTLREVKGKNHRSQGAVARLSQVVYNFALCQ